MSDVDIGRKVPRILVVGGANLDMKCTSLTFVQAETSNPGRVWSVDGGVGRNIAENLAALGADVRFLGPFGDDAAGVRLRQNLEARGVLIDGCPVVSGVSTGTYVAILQPSGDLAVAISDMRIMDTFDACAIRLAVAQFRDDDVQLDLVCIDANLRPDAIAAVLDFADACGAKSVLEPVSVAKAQRILDSGLARRIHTVTPNRDELAAMSGMTVATVEDLGKSTDVLLGLGFQRVVVTLGADGVYCKGTANGQRTALSMPARKTVVVDVTGAGDAFTAGVAYGLAAQYTDNETLLLGQAIASKLVTTTDSVLKGMFEWNRHVLAM